MSAYFNLITKLSLLHSQSRLKNSYSKKNKSATSNRK